MKPSERINHIKQIARELAKEDWSHLDLTLKQFMLPTVDLWNGNDKQSYVIEMLMNVDDGPLLDVAKHLGLASELESQTTPTFWKESDARVFLSHLAINKIQTSKIKNELLKYGIMSLVAHEDIEPSKEWQIEIESALSTMDGLVALLTPGFKESNWCDQEVGVAIGRKLPILAVRIGLDPYGLIGKFQAIQGAGKNERQLAHEIYNLFIKNPIVGPKIMGALITNLDKSHSFIRSKELVSMITSSNYVTEKHALAMKLIAEKNAQVSGSWGVSEQIDEIAQKFSV